MSKIAGFTLSIMTLAASLSAQADSSDTKYWIGTSAAIGGIAAGGYGAISASTAYMQAQDNIKAAMPTPMDLGNNTIGLDQQAHLKMRFINGDTAVITHTSDKFRILGEKNFALTLVNPRIHSLQNFDDALAKVSENGTLKAIGSLSAAESKKLFIDSRVGIIGAGVAVLGAALLVSNHNDHLRSKTIEEYNISRAVASDIKPIESPVSESDKESARAIIERHLGPLETTNDVGLFSPIPSAPAPTVSKPNGTAPKK